MGHRILIVGRGRRADIQLGDKTVSRLHVDLVMADAGVIHITDRSSANGTWIEMHGRWKRITQRAVVPSDRLRLGSFLVTVSELVRRVQAHDEIDRTGRESAAKNGACRPDDRLPRGPVRRNPRTGEVIADRRE